MFEWMNSTIKNIDMIATRRDQPGFPQNMQNQILWLFYDQSTMFHDLLEVDFICYLISTQYGIE